MKRSSSDCDWWRTSFRYKCSLFLPLTLRSIARHVEQPRDSGNEWDFLNEKRFDKCFFLQLNMLIFMHRKYFHNDAIEIGGANKVRHKEEISSIVYCTLPHTIGGSNSNLRKWDISRWKFLIKKPIQGMLNSEYILFVPPWIWTRLCFQNVYNPGRITWTNRTTWMSYEASWLH